MNDNDVDRILAELGRINDKLDALVGTQGAHHGRIVALEALPKQVADLGTDHRGLDVRVRKLEELKAQLVLIGVAVPVIVTIVARLIH